MQNIVKYHGCGARAIIKDGNFENVMLTFPHSHDVDKKYVHKAVFYEKLEENIKLDPFEKPLKLHLITKNQLSNTIDEGYLHTAKETRSFIAAKQKDDVPRLPKTVKEFESFIAQDKYQKNFTTDSKNLPSYCGVWESDKGEKSVVFISTTVLKIVNTLNYIALFMDGTFKALP